MTSLPVLQNQFTQPPDCFGGPLWDPKVTECAGGVDLMYTNKVTGSHIREKCQFFDSCGAKVSAMRAPNGAIQLPQRTLPPPPSMQPVVSSAASRTQVPQMSQPMFRPQQAAPQPWAPPQQQAQYAQPQYHPQMMQGPWHPAPTYQFNHGIPNYLTTPEPIAPGESIWSALFRELFRGIVKSAGHTMSYFVDTNPMRRLPPNQ